MISAPRASLEQTPTSGRWTSTAFATLLARNGVSPAVAQKLLRHSDIRLTMNIYTHLDLADTAGGTGARIQTSAGTDSIASKSTSSESSSIHPTVSSRSV